MTINLDYAAEERPQGTFVKPFCYVVEDGDAPVRDANHALRLVGEFTDKLEGEHATTPPPDGWRPVFRIAITVEDVRGREDATYCVGDYTRLAFDARFNAVCANYMELYAALKRTVKKAMRERHGKSSAKAGKGRGGR